MNEEPVQGTQGESQPQTMLDREMLGNITDGMSWETKWWGFHLHFTHISIQALKQAGFAETIFQVIGEVVPEPFGALIAATMELRWAVMQQIDAETGNGVKLTSPWVAPGMLIPSKRGVPSDLLYWMVYGDPQETAVYGYPPEIFTYDAANGVWGDHEKFPGNRSAEGAGLAVYNDALYCVHRGSPDKYLWYSAFDGDKSWSDGVNFPSNPSSNDNPAVAVYKNSLHCVFLGTDNALYHKVFDGSNWGGHTKIVNSAGTGAALAAYNNGLHCVFRGTNKELYYKVLNGSNWEGHVSIESSAGSGAALAVYNDRLHCVFLGTNKELYHKVLNGSNWGGHATIGSSAGEGPALAVYKDCLHCVFRGKDDKKLFHTFFNGSSWSGHTNLQRTADGQPGLAVYHDKYTNIVQLFCVFRGA